jgi:hypothetical protein
MPTYEFLVFQNNEYQLNPSLDSTYAHTPDTTRNKYKVDIHYSEIPKIHM